MSDSPPFGQYAFSVFAKNMHAAAKEAVPKLAKIGFCSGYNDVWNAKVIDPGDEANPYEILSQGAWLISFKTGKPKKTLEERV